MELIILKCLNIIQVINDSAYCRWSKTAGYGIIARTPLQFGLLTGKFDASVNFPVNDHRKKRVTKDVVDACNLHLQPVWTLCEKYKVTKTQLALSYILSYSEISTVIPGIRTAQQVESNTNGLIQLTKLDMKFIEELGNTDFVALVDLIRQKED